MLVQRAGVAGSVRSCEGVSDEASKKIVLNRNISLDRHNTELLGSENIYGTGAKRRLRIILRNSILKAKPDAISASWLLGGYFQYISNCTHVRCKIMH